MVKLKRTLNVRVKDKAQMLSLMKKLGALDVDLEAESRPGLVRVVAHGTRDQIRELELKMKGFLKSQL